MHAIVRHCMLNYAKVLLLYWYTTKYATKQNMQEYAIKVP